MSIRILQGDCRDMLRTLDAGSIQTCVTSPPYFGLRDYGVAGQIGLEPTPDEFIAAMVEVFREVRRVLADDGTLWLNLGDSYAGTGATGGGDDSARRGADGYGGKSPTGKGTWRSPLGTGYKVKDLMMIPARVALALQADSWWLRSHIIWHKPNPMPESVTDRPTSAHESMFLLSKSARYFYNADAVRIPYADASLSRFAQDIDGQAGSDRANGNTRPDRPMKAVGGQRVSDKQRGHSRRHAGFNDRWDAMERGEQIAGGANLRNVWTVATQPFAGAHFATFPPALIEPCIKAGSRPGDTVLDPFGGAGTTGLVADRLGRNAMLIELNPDYADMARERIRGDAPLFAEFA